MLAVAHSVTLTRNIRGILDHQLVVGPQADVLYVLQKAHALVLAAIHLTEHRGRDQLAAMVKSQRTNSLSISI